MRWSLYAQHEFAESNIRTIMKNVIKECLNKEAQALRSLIDTVDDEYVKIVTLFAHCEGKLVITGVGKSLLVGKKIAASFVSLGIKAIALSPLSMMHGDIGLLDKKDILVCFSKSGETKILCNIIEWVKMHIKIPVVSILGTALSTIYFHRPDAAVHPTLPYSTVIPRTIKNGRQRRINRLHRPLASLQI